MNIPNFIKSTKGLFLGLLICFGIFTLLPLLSYQPFLAQGDHGLNFYCFQQTALGEIPTKDFFWPYGPLMPYYFASLMNLFNDSMQVVFLGRILICIIAGIFCYLTLSLYFHPLLCFAAGVWLWAFHPDFFYTYNHFGAIALFFAVGYFLVLYVKSNHIKHIYAAIVMAFLATLIRVNMGVALWAGIILCYLAAAGLDKNFKLKEFIKIIVTVFCLMIVTGGIYWLLLHNLPAYQIKQVMPYFEQGYYNASAGKRCVEYLRSIWDNIHISNPANFALAIFVGLFIIKLINLCRFSTDTKLKRDISLIFLFLFILLIAVSHEFFLGTHAYRIVWMKPFHLLLLFFVIGFATNDLSTTQKTLIYFMLLLIASQIILQLQQKSRRDKLAFYYLPHPKAKLYISNDPFWSETVNNTAQYLKNNLKDGELFLALPYEPLYYYLTDKKSPVWELMFFKNLNMPLEQEDLIIAEIKKKNVPLILLSNRIFSPEVSSGMFGQDYGVKLAQYIDSHYKVVVQFGDWKSVAGWNNFHATRILKRIDE